MLYAKKALIILLAVMVLLTAYPGLGLTYSVAAESPVFAEEPEAKENTIDATDVAYTVAIDGLSKEKQEEYEQDGTLADRRAFAMELQAANEAYYTTFSVDVDNTVNVSDIANILPNEYAPNMPTTGTASVLAFLVDFPDTPHDSAVTREKAEQVFFGEEDSLKSTYYTSSYGQLTVDGDVQDWYTAKHDKDYYVQNGIAALYKEVLDAFDAQIDYSEYDADNNGYIDGLYIHFAGEDTGWGSTFWSYVTFIGNMQYDNISIGHRVCLLHQLNVDTICHESGHLLGLPDYYSYTIKTIFGNFNWVGADMMVDGSADFNAVSKMQLGWIKQVKVLRKSGQYSLDEFSEAGDAAIVYPFGESEGDSFLVLEKATDYNGDNILKVFRVNAKTDVMSDGSSSYVHSNMYGEIPFIELIRDMKGGETVDPYDQDRSTHYYNDEEKAITFSGITVDLAADALTDDSAVFDLLLELGPSKIEPPVIHVTASVNQITATVDYSTPFAIDTQVVPYLEDSDGQRIATMDVKAIFGDTGYYIDKASCVLKVASYMEWGFDGKNEITVGSDQDYLLKPGATYTVVVPKGAFRTVMGDIDELRIEVTADATAVTTQKYQAISSFDRCSEYVSLSDGRAAYAYVNSLDDILRLALVSEDGTTEEYVIAEDMLGCVGLCQLSDGTLAIAATCGERDRAVYYKFSLTSGDVIATIEQLIEEFELELYAFDGGFYSASDNNYTTGKIFYIDNAFTEITEVLPEYRDDFIGSVVLGTGKYVVGDKILYITNDTEEEYVSPDSPPVQSQTNKFRFTLYNADGTEYASTALIGFDRDVQLLGADVDKSGNVVLAYCDMKAQKIRLLIFDERMRVQNIVTPDFPMQRINTGGIICDGILFKCIGDGYFLCYEYVRQYNPSGLVEIFNTETYQQGWLMDGNFDVKCVFDVAYKASAAALGADGNRFIVGDEYGYYTVEADLTAETPAVLLSSDIYTIDNGDLTITDVPRGTTAGELLKFIQSNQDDCRYDFRYTHAERTAAISAEQVLSCKYELVVYTQNDTVGTVYTLPELPLNSEDEFNIRDNGGLFNYTATEPDLVVPDFVKSITGSVYSVDLNCVTSLTTSANIYDLYLPNLTTLNIEGCEVIRGLAYCHKLKEVIIPDTVTELSYDAFSYCDGLEKIVIPATVTRIARGVFEGLTNENLNIIYLGTREQWEKIDFRIFDFSSPDDLYDWEAEFGEHLTFAGSGFYEPAPTFEISDVFMTQKPDMKINVKVKKSLFEAIGYVQPYIEFIFNSEMYYVSEYTEQGDYYVFSSSVIAPDQMNRTLYATLYATHRGTLYHTDTAEIFVESVDGPDVNGDGAINVIDLQLAARYIAQRGVSGVYDLSECNVDLMDENSDGVVDQIDLNLISAVIVAQ